MEDVLDVYKRPYDPDYPVVCMDETSKQLTDEVRTPLEVKPGEPKRHDTEYVRNGVCNIFLHCEPLTGKRHTSVTDHRKKMIGQSLSKSWLMNSIHRQRKLYW